MAVLISACGGNGSAATTTTVQPSTTTPSIATKTTTVASTTTTAEATTTSSPPTTSTSTATTLAGQLVDFGPAHGDLLMVIGVRYDDVLNLRHGPGANQKIVAEIPPTSRAVVALGSTRQLPGSFWTAIEFDGEPGWAHMGYLGYEGDVDDLTASVIDELGERPTEPTMTGLGERVAGEFRSEEPESGVVQVTEVTSGDLTEVTYDVIGLGDDAVRGVRVHVFAEETNDGFTLKSVEVTAICGRGVDKDGLCV